MGDACGGFVTAGNGVAMGMAAGGMAAAGAVMVKTSWHFGQRTFFPASESSTDSLVAHLGQLLTRAMTSLPEKCTAGNDREGEKDVKEMTRLYGHEVVNL
jgi:hypothetical protein